MKAFPIVMTAALLIGCCKTDRATCVAAAKGNYYEAIALCKERGIESYDECDRLHQLEHRFSTEQKACYE